MSCVASVSCDSCLKSSCGWCSTDSLCYPEAQTFDSSICAWSETYFLSAECSQTQNFKTYIGVCAGIAALFVLWTVYRCRTSSSLKGIKASEGMEKVYEEKDLVDVAFRDVNLQAFQTNSWKTAVLYAISAVLSFYFIYGLITDTLFLVSTVNSAQNSLAVAYALTMFVSLGLLGFDTYRAKAVLRTEDISDCFTNNDAARWLRLRKPMFNFFTALSNDFTRHDKVAFFIFFAINDARRLLLVELPQFIFVNIAVVSISPQGRCEKQTNDAFCLLAQCQQCLKDHSPDPIHQDIRYVKIAFLVLSGLRFLFSAACYPFLRVMIARKFKDCQGPVTRGSIRSYCTYLIDKRVTELLHDTKGSVAPDFFARASRKVPSFREKLPMAEVVMPSQLSVGGPPQGGNGYSAGPGGYPAPAAQQVYPAMAAQVVYSPQVVPYGVPPPTGGVYGAPVYATAPPAAMMVSGPVSSQLPAAQVVFQSASG